MTKLDANETFESLLEYLKTNRGFDFTGYKRSSLMRRVNKRMEVLGVENYGAYQDYLEVHPDEFAHLFNTILINVTNFFRDSGAWEFLGAEVLPKLLEKRSEAEPIRLWSAGCASGEEAYTLAMVIAENLGIEQARERMKIYATDVDEEALLKARHAAYSAHDLQGVPEPVVNRYFEQIASRYVFHKELRRAVIFGRHDLIQDAPISKIDLLVCRNTLMYFNNEAQSRILDRFHFALSDDGYLFLGKAETLLTQQSLFAPVDFKQRVFMKVPKNNHRVRTPTLMRDGVDESMNSLVSHVRVREAAFDAGPVAQIVLDTQNVLALANSQARERFGLGGGDLGLRLQDLQISYRPVELRSCIERALAQRTPVELRGVESVGEGGETVTFDVQVYPLHDGAGNALGVQVSFLDVTGFKRLQNELERSNRQLETAYEELQSSNEELETTNEELQSTIEELETTNEELQSTNEELETMNEELQSSNEELETLNVELNQRGEELNEVNKFLESILVSLRCGVVVVDRDLLVRVWNKRSEDLWGLRSDEVRGKNLLNLDIGLPVERLKQPLNQSLARTEEGDDGELMLDAVNRRGKSIVCRITCSPLSGPHGDRQGVIVLMEENDVSAPPTTA